MRDKSRSGGDRLARVPKTLSAGGSAGSEGQAYLVLAARDRSGSGGFSEYFFLGGGLSPSS
jgi:hypothetical protein